MDRVLITFLVALPILFLNVGLAIKSFREYRANGDLFYFWSGVSFIGFCLAILAVPLVLLLREL